MDFQSFPKIARLNREIIITEKIDGTNGQIAIAEDGVTMFVGSQTRWITPEDDNFGFAAWAKAHYDELLTLGPGRHFGEWWGAGIQRGYGLKEKRWSLFNTQRWTNSEMLPSCCRVVPVLYQGVFDPIALQRALTRLREYGSSAAPGFMNPEGMMVFHIAGNIGFKVTLDKDDAPKGKA
jgi:hypothetical protein